MRSRFPKGVSVLLRILGLLCGLLTALAARDLLAWLLARPKIRLPALACLLHEVAINGPGILRRAVNDFSLWRLIEYPVITQMLDLQPGAWVLDIGSGTSSYPLMLAREGATVVLAELDEERVRWQRDKLAAQGGIRGTMYPVVADATALPFRDAAFGRVSAISSIEHIPDDRAVGREIGRVLRPGGVAAISVPYTFGERESFFAGIRDFARVGRNEFRQVGKGGLVRFYTDDDVEQRFGPPVGCHITERCYFGRRILNDGYHETRLTRYWNTLVLKDLLLAWTVHPLEEALLRHTEPFDVMFRLERARD
ncbi:MAG: class I SAM-dependent methyltransferase [Chloroflexia bacterium]|nr:class I SAM-dependent methyltransferase [Chloroflexia bacterium]